MKNGTLEQVVIKKDWKRRKSEIRHHNFGWVVDCKTKISKNIIEPLIDIIDEFYESKGEGNV